jgi:hypothetical protein
VTSRILLNKWQRQQEKERYQKRKYKEEKRRYEEEEYMREQERAHWGCAFFRHCPECSDRYTEYRQDTAIADPSMKELEGYILVMVGI